MKSSRTPSKAGSPPARRAPARPRAAPPARGLAVLEACERGTFPPTLYVDGPDESLKAALLADLRHAWAHAVPEAPTPRVLRAAESEVAELLAIYHGSSLFSPRELAIVLDVEDLGRSEKKVVALAEGLARPSGGTTLVLVESAADTARKSLEPLRSACTARWTAERPGRAELLAWGTRRLARAGVRAAPGVLESVADTCEDDACAFFNELDKLAVFAGPDGTLTPGQARELRRPVLDAGLPDYLAAVALGDAARATQRLGRLLATGAGEGAVLFALQNLVGGALGGWSRERELSAALGRRLGTRDLARALDALYRAEAAWKRGRADVTAVLEHVTRVVSAGGPVASPSTRT